MSLVMPDAGFAALPGSERTALPTAEVAGPIDPSERVEVTLITRRRDKLPPDLVSGTSVITRDELSARYGADPADLDLIREVLARYGIQVMDVDLGGRRITVVGTIAGLEETFGASLHLVATPHPTGSQGMIQHRYREGALRLPAELDGIVLAVLGLDNRPQARAHVRRPDYDAVHSSYTPPQVAGIYQFPAGTDGTGQTLAFIELGGGFSQSDLDLYFSSLGLSTPSVTAIDVDGASNVAGQDLFSADDEVAANIEIAGGGAWGYAVRVFRTQHRPGFRGRRDHGCPRGSHTDHSWHQLGKSRRFLDRASSLCAGPGFRRRSGAWGYCLRRRR